jgi:hypothetical protein
MATSLSRVQKPHLFSPSLESRIKSVIRALNGDDERKPEVEFRPRALLLVVKRLQEFYKAWLKQETPRPPTRRRIHQQPFGSSPALGKLSPLLRFVQRYEAYPSLEIWEDPSDGGRGMPLRELRVAWYPIGKFKQRKGELDLVLDIIEIARAGRISSLKQCAQCRKWLFARFPHQRFCTAACKESFHATNETDKERRRKWARENYQSRKEIELGSRKAAQRTKGK